MSDLTDDSPAALRRDIEAVSRIEAVPSILRVICEKTAMGYAAVARVTDHTWMACAVQDNVHFGLTAGAELDLRTTLCFESRAAREAIVIDHFDEDPQYRGHHTSRIYSLQSYISVPIVLSDGRYFGNLCAIDAQPRSLKDPRTISMFEAYAQLIALQLEYEEQRSASEFALSKARETSELREQFIAVLGHDLRNPLSAVSAIAEVLVLKAESPNTERLGLRLRSSSRRMSALIDDVMDFARGRMGSGIGVNIAPETDMSVALRNVIDELRLAHPNRLIEDGIGTIGTVHCDRARVQQLLSNLLGNAITHGSSEFPVCVEASADDGSFSLTVRNGGDVMGPDTLKKVFQPYWRPATSAPGGGLGLGLFICKQIVSAHEGDLTVTSSLIEGTRFTARLPIHGRRQD